MFTFNPMTILYFQPFRHKLLLLCMTKHPFSVKSKHERDDRIVKRYILQLVLLMGKGQCLFRWVTATDS